MEGARPRAAHYGTRVAVNRSVKGRRSAMLDAFIIEEIKRRDREQTRDDRPVVELPVPQPIGPAHHDDGPQDPDRGRGGGVVIIDYTE
jgi:hypothetical protein